MTGWVRALLWSVGLVVALFTLLWVFQRRLIYLPGDMVPPVDSTLPGWSETRVTTDDSEQLGVWYTTPAPGAATVVVFNGNAGTRADRAALGRRLAQAGLGVVLFDYRGYGDSTGRPSEQGLTRDAAAIAGFAAGIEPGAPLAYFGESLGAAVAVRLAATTPPSALVLRSPFTSMADVAAAHYPLPFESFLRDRFPSDRLIGEIESPVLVVAGSSDSIVPTVLSRRLFDLASEPKELVVVERANHNDHALLAGDRLIEAVIGFIDDHVGRE